jgi:hypothetical protein
MSIGRSQTIKRQLADLGIVPSLFDEFYEHLEVHGLVPPCGGMDEEQYEKILCYLQSHDVVAEDGAVQPEAYQLLSAKMKLEAEMSKRKRSAPKAKKQAKPRRPIKTGGARPAPRPP